MVIAMTTKTWDPRVSKCWLCGFHDRYNDGLIGWCHLKDAALCETDEEKYDRENMLKLCRRCHGVLDARLFALTDDGTLTSTCFASNVYHLYGMKEGMQIMPYGWSAARARYNRERINDKDAFDAAMAIAKARSEDKEQECQE